MGTFEHLCLEAITLTLHHPCFLVLNHHIRTTLEEFNTDTFGDSLALRSSGIY